MNWPAVQTYQWSKCWDNADRIAMTKEWNNILRDLLKTLIFVLALIRFMRNNLESELLHTFSKKIEFKMFYLYYYIINAEIY